MSSGPENPEFTQQPITLEEALTPEELQEIRDAAAGVLSDTDGWINSLLQEFPRNDFADPEKKAKVVAYIKREAGFLYM